MKYDSCKTAHLNYQSNLAVLDTEITMDIMSGSYQIDWKLVMCLCKGDQRRGTVKCAVQ